MKTLRRWIRDYFGFNGAEINGFIVLIFIMVLLTASMLVRRAYVFNGNPEPLTDSKRLDSLVALWDSSKSGSSSSTDSLFAFDPNLVSQKELELLGFSHQLAARMVTYREKGGRFRRPEDVMKIYGMDSSLYQRVRKLMRFPTASGGPTGTKQSEQRQVVFDINQADSVQLDAIPGIGVKLAARILKFRKALGGYIDEKQFEEIYGLDSMVVRALKEKTFIKPDFVPVKININKADASIMEAHPYISPKQAIAIVAYRFQHGVFNSIEDIGKTRLFREDEVKRLLPYLSIGEGQ